MVVPGMCACAATRCALGRRVVMTRNMKRTMSSISDELLRRGWIRKGDFLVRFSSPRIGWKPEDGTLVVGWHEWPRKVNSLEEIDEIIKGC